MNAVDQTAKPVQSFDWGVIKWYVTPDDTEGANLTFGEVVLLPGKGHERHNHPDAEEILYVLAGEGEQMLDDGGENSFPIKAGDTIYVPTAMFHSTVNTGWQPLRLLALYNPGGSEKALRDLPDFREGDGPDWSLEAWAGHEPHGPADRDPRHQGRRVRLPARSPARRRAWTCCWPTWAAWRRRASRRTSRARRWPSGTGADLSALAEARDRGAAVTAMADAAAVLAKRLHDEGRIDGVLAAGGSGNTAIATRAMQALPVGVPKLMVSTMAAGDTRDYVGSRDVAMMASVADVAGLNAVSARVLANAAAAMAGMVQAPAVELADERPLVGASMFGVTTPCVTAAREELEALGYEPVVFHATGVGGMAMEGLMESGFLKGVLDATTTELCDDLVGGVLSAGPDRLEMAGRLGIPQVVSVGALDMVNFGARDTVPAQFEERNLYVHNPSITLMRTTEEENAELGRRIARKLSAATGPTALFVPLGGRLDDRRRGPALPRSRGRRRAVRGAAARWATAWSWSSST